VIIRQKEHLIKSIRTVYTAILEEFAKRSEAKILLGIAFTERQY